MTLTISLPGDAETRLKDRAKAAGQDVTRYVEQMIARELAAPLSLIEAAEPLARAVDAAGMTDDEYTSLLVQAREAELARDVAMMRRAMKEIDDGKGLDARVAFDELREKLLAMKTAEIGTAK